MRECDTAPADRSLWIGEEAQVSPNLRSLLQLHDQSMQPRHVGPGPTVAPRSDRERGGVRPLRQGTPRKKAKWRGASSHANDVPKNTALHSAVLVTCHMGLLNRVGEMRSSNG